jgi:hypothetical protein
MSAWEADALPLSNEYLKLFRQKLKKIMDLSGLRLVG